MEQELNQRLAIWAGIKYEPDQDVFKVIFPDGSWYNIGHDWKLDEIEPDFTQSLDACFKWLVPKLKFVAIDGEAGHFNAGLFQTENFDYYNGEAETPALALCLAIEKLIG